MKKTWRNLSYQNVRPKLIKNKSYYMKKTWRNISNQYV